MLPLLILLLSATASQPGEPIAQVTDGVDAPSQAPPRSPPPRAKAAPPAPSPAAQTALARGLRLLDEFEFEQSKDALEAALAQGPYGYRDVVALYHALGIVRAFLGEDDAAQEAFEVLLAIAPNHALAYTTSPKATFLFQKAKDATRARRAIAIEVNSATVVPLEHPIAVQVELASNPKALVKDVVLRWRLKGESEWKKLPLGALATRAPRTLSLPAVPQDAAVDFGDGALGAIVETQAIGYSAQGWEIYVGEHVEIPVGFDAPGPLYTRWWVWAAAGGVTAALTATAGAIAAAIVFQPLPEDATFQYRVEP